MTPNQEEALYNYLDNITLPFSLEEVTRFVRLLDSEESIHLPFEIAAMIDSRKLAFKLKKNQWLSKRGFFEDVSFIISPTKLELLNGILISGHRCIPFANMIKMPQDYEFFWNNKKIPHTTTEGPPEEFYPYYNFFGEEYAPQYIARDNPENDCAFTYDPYEDPPEVSIHTLDMRNIYREAAFVPGDSFLVKTKNWKKGYFNLEKADKSQWHADDLSAWIHAAENGFKKSFTKLGPGSSTEEQIAYAYWYGEKRMRELPAYSLEEFIYERTDQIENITYGIETRFWFAGKDIPDSEGLSGIFVPPDRTVIENILFKVDIPISEYVILSYIRDALYRNNINLNSIIEHIVPPVIKLAKKERNVLAGFIIDVFENMSRTYSIFLDKDMGPLRQRAAELHHAVVELAAQLQKGLNDSSCLPRHTFIVLSQIQGHAASLLEDLGSDETPLESDLNAMENSLDSMVDVFNDIKDMINDSMDSYRRNNLLLVQPSSKKTIIETWRTVQISIDGSDVWRRVTIPVNKMLKNLHRIIQIVFDWNDIYPHQFFIEDNKSADRKILDDKINLQILIEKGNNELQYDYGTKWKVKILILNSEKPGINKTARCSAGEGAPPPESVGGPFRFSKLLKAIEKGGENERKAAIKEIGYDFIPWEFDMEKCNKNLENLL